jgi:thiamine pyrophosphokinase
MRTPIIQSSNPVTLIGGGEVGPGDLDLALLRAPLLVAADGGAALAWRAGHDPVAVIGDFDSLSSETRDRIPADRLFLIREQNSTDFDKALRNIQAPLVLAVGFLGARVDHQLAAFNILVRRADRPCILIGPSEVIFHAPHRLTLDLSDGDIVSLFPMARVVGRSQGLKWPIDGLEMAPDGAIGTSNRAVGTVHLELEGPGLLVIVPRAALDAVIRALWPNHAAPTGAGR